jgi:succinate-acetate transporter protein
MDRVPVSLDHILPARGRRYGDGIAWRHAGGFMGLLTGADALYLSFAEVTNATARKVVLPVGGPILK